MKNKLLLIGSLLLSSTVLSAINTDTKTFFAGPTDKDVKLPADRVFPQGRKFPFSFYSTGGANGLTKKSEIMPPEKRFADTTKIVSGGATLIGPQYELNFEVVDTARKYKVQAVMTVSGIIGGKKIDKAFFKGREKLDVEALKKETVPYIRELAKNPEIAYWNVTPEERRYWRKKEMAYLDAMYKIIKENDPQKRPVFMYEPGHRGASALAKTLPYMDICAKGSYTNYSNHKTNRAWVRYSIGEQVEATKIAKRGIPFLLPEMFQQPAPEEIKLIDSWVRHDCYCGLANGAKGILVFSARRRPHFTAWEDYVNAYLGVAKTLSGELGQALLFGKETSDIEVSITEGPEKVEVKMRKENQTCPSLSVKQLVWNNARYVLIVNSADTPVKAVVDNLVYGSNIAVCDLLNVKGENFTAPEGNFEVELAPLQAVCYKIYCK